LFSSLPCQLQNLGVPRRGGLNADQHPQHLPKQSHSQPYSRGWAGELRSQASLHAAAGYSQFPLRQEKSRTPRHALSSVGRE